MKLKLNDFGQALARNRNWLIPTATGFVGFVTGAAAGASVVLRQKNKQISDDLDSLVKMNEATIRSHQQFDEEFETRVLQMAEKIIYHGTAARYHETEELPPHVEEAVRETIEAEDERKRVSVFTTSHDDAGLDDWNYDEEVKKRSPEEPYIIHREEFDANELDLRQSTLTWYERDEILTDEKDSVIYDVNGLVGDFQFGHGSQDQSICYVRNEKLRGEYEIILDHGSYQVQVLGADIENELEKRELRHATPKFRE